MASLISIKNIFFAILLTTVSLSHRIRLPVQQINKVYESGIPIDSLLQNRGKFHLKNLRVSGILAKSELHQTLYVYVYSLRPDTMGIKYNEKQIFVDFAFFEKDKGKKFIDAHLNNKPITIEGIFDSTSK